MRNNHLMLMLVLIALIPQNSEARRSDVPVAGIIYGTTVSGYVYMSGGVHLYERRFMEQRSAPYNLRLHLVPSPVIALPELRVFVANNAIGKIEQIPLSGPWIYFRLPPGTYTIGARINRKFFLLRNVHVRDAGQQTHILRGNSLPSIMNRENRGAK